MDCFVNRFQPKTNEAWLAGENLGHHPCDDPNMAMSIASPPSAEEFHNLQNQILCGIKTSRKTAVIKRKKSGTALKRKVSVSTTF